MIRADGLAARAAPLQIRGVSLALGPGVHALLGTRDDGVSLALATMAGAASPRAGRLAVLGLSPRSAGARRAIAYVPMVPVLPDALRVDEALDLAADLRGESRRPAVERLASLGVAALARRKVRTLSPHEARAVALAEGATSRHVRVILIDEPLVAMDARAAAAMAGVLRGCAREGACVVLTTASPRDAGDLADGFLLFTQGVVVRIAALAEGVVPTLGARATRLRIVADDARALLAELAHERELTSLACRGDALAVGGADEASIAAAVARAAVRAGATIHELRADPAPLEELRAAFAGDAAGTYAAAHEAAVERARRSHRPPPSSWTPPPGEGR